MLETRSLGVLPGNSAFGIGEDLGWVSCGGDELRWVWA